MIAPKLAWRNLWRNRSRTLITTASVFFAVILSVLLNSLQNGVYNNVIKEAVNFYSGYIQIHRKNFWDERDLEYSIIQHQSLLDSIRRSPEIKNASSRLESFMLASQGERTKGCFVVGIEPAYEAEMIRLQDKLIEGKYLASQDEAVLIAKGLADKLKVKLNDTIVLIGQGYHGATAAGKYPVQGILKFGLADLNESFLFMPLARVQYLLSADSLVTSLVIMPRKIKSLEALKAKFASVFGRSYEVHTWQELMPYLDQHIRMCLAGGYIFIGILYVIIAFSIFATLLMMTVEREKEFQMLVSIGMRRRQLATVVLIESVFISLCGALIGSLASFPIAYLLKIRPITISGPLQEAYASFGFGTTLPASTQPEIFLSQTLIVLVIALVLSCYPLYKILTLKTAVRKQSGNL